VYITSVHIARALPDEGTVDNWSGGNATKVEQAIRTAQGEVDGYLLSGGYTVPLNSPPENVLNYTIDIAVYNLAVMSGFRSDAADNELKIKYEKALDFLRGVATGKYRIPLPSGGGEETAAPQAGFRVRSKKKMDLGGYWDGRL